MSYFAGQDYYNNGYALNAAPADVDASFAWNGHGFPGGVLKVHAPMWAAFLSELNGLIIGGIHPGPSNVSGCWGGEARNNVNNPSKPSFHRGYIAIDVNAPWNGNGSGWQNGRQYGIPSAAGALAAKYGLLAGGNFDGTKDPMHFEVHQTKDFYIAHWPQGGAVKPPVVVNPNKPGTPFPLPAGYYFGPLSGPTQSISGMAPSGSDAKYRPYIARVQRVVGVAADGLYGPNSIAAVTRWQRTHNLTADGLVGPATWLKMGV